jgi:Ca2+-transporting ATPase
MIKAGILCNNSEIERTGEDNEYRGMGSPTETSLLILGAKTGLFSESFDYRRINEYTFNSDRKMMSILYYQNGKRIVYAKGAPEIILEKCNQTYDNGNIKTLSKEDISKIADLQREMAKSAFRTLALCYKEVEGVDENYEEDEFVFLGIVAMEDSPREEVSKAIKTAMRAGINVYMITGDSRETALSIAKQIGLDTSDRVLDGQEIDQLSDKELEVKVREVNLFARVKPEHKIRLVRIFKELGETVAMTGDGVNDAPALKEAHVGIAMGKNGTDVSRSSADLILKDDNFATIVSAITEGRTVFNNIRKFVTYQLSCNLAEILTLLVGVIVAPIFGWYTPLLVSIQILFMNLVTDNLPALTLGLNPTSIDIMEEKPRNTENILNKELIKLLITTASFMAVSVLSAYYVSHNVLGLSTDVSRTTALLTFILIEISTAFSFRSFRKFTLNRSPLVNKHLVIASLASMLFTILIIYTPLNVIFETVHIGPLEWTIAIIFNLIMMFFNDITKIINLKNESYLADTR